MSTEYTHPIGVVARQTGLTSHVIRIWEKRYGAIEPQRTPTNRRLYSDRDIARLQLLRRATLTGHSIGQVSRLSDEQLRALVAADESSDVSPFPKATTRREDVSPQAILDACIDHVERLDAAGMQDILTRASVLLSQPALIEQVIVPLMYRIGDLWHEGALRVAHEHLTSAVVRTLLGSMSRGFIATASAPNLVVATPSGHLHELGALIVATVAAADGWRVTYLGPSLPAEEIAGAAQQHGAQAVALSIIYPTDDPYLRQELMTLRRGLASGVAILVGGQAAAAYQDVLQEVDAVWVKDLSALRKCLELIRLRKPDAPSPS
jgi:DNA-binding transcriptional MerR regulator/methylmalonyl-CoA mutase cobalamin-binding subunit